MPNVNNTAYLPQIGRGITVQDGETIRDVPGRATSARIFSQATTGDAITIEGLFGSSFLRDKHRGPSLA